MLIPDFKGSQDALRIVVEARPEILNHNVETVPRLFRKVQPQDRYEWAQATLSNAKRIDPEVLTKSGIMLGLGETFDEVVAVMRDLRTWGVEILTVGQYLQPSKQHLPVERFYTLDEFAELRRIGLGGIGFPLGRIGSAGALVLSRRSASPRALDCASQAVGDARAGERGRLSWLNGTQSAHRKVCAFRLNPRASSPPHARGGDPGTESPR